MEQCYCPWQKERTGQVVKKGDSMVPFLKRKLVENEVQYKLPNLCTKGALRGLKVPSVTDSLTF